MSSQSEVARANVARAVALLREGRLVAFPTETVYGLGADATNSESLARLYAVKRRPTDHPVIVHLSAQAGLDDWARQISQSARDLAAAFWPGPLTLVLQADARVSRRATGGLDTVGLRVPSHPMARELLDEFGGGVAAPSANRFGRVSPPPRLQSAPTSATTWIWCSMGACARWGLNPPSWIAPARWRGYSVRER